MGEVGEKVSVEKEVFGAIFGGLREGFMETLQQMIHEEKAEPL